MRYGGSKAGDRAGGAEAGQEGLRQEQQCQNQAQRSTTELIQNLQGQSPTGSGKVL